MLDKLLWLHYRRFFAREYEFKEETRTIDGQKYKVFLLDQSQFSEYTAMINNYILNKSKLDLPQSQFHKNMDQLDLEDCIEIGGIIGAGSNPKDTTELIYFSPLSSQTNLRMQKSLEFPFLRVNFFTRTGIPLFIYHDNLDFRFYLEWHTHPGKGRRLSNQDIYL